MHEQMFREFTERAEAEIGLPDLAVLEERGRRLRRDRARGAVAAAAAAVVLVVGSVVLVASSGGDVVQPAPQPDKVVVQEPVHDEELSAGRSYTVPVWGQTYADTVDPGETIAATFRVDGSAWAWYRDRISKFGPVPYRKPHQLDAYAAVQLSLVDRIPVDQCRAKDLRWKDAADDPLGVARQIADVPGVQVVRAPRRSEWLGYPAAHLGFRVPEICPGVGIVLWNAFPASTLGEPGIGTALRAGQVFDTWVMDVEGSLVVLSIDHSPEVPRSMVDEANALAASIRIDVLRQ